MVANVTRVRGVVEALNRQGTGLKVGGVWYNYSLPQYRQQPWDDVAAGDSVVLTTTESNGREYVGTIELEAPAQQAPEPAAAASSDPVARRRALVGSDDKPIVTRLACLNAAVRLYAVAPLSTDCWIAVQDVESLAERLVGWVYGTGGTE